MKTALMFFRQAEDSFSAEYYASVENTLRNGGVFCSSILTVSSSDDIGFKRHLNEFKDTVDTLIIVGGEKPSFNLKDIIAEVTETVLIENDTAKRFLDAVRNSADINYPSEYAVMPMEATVLPNIIGGFQGFILDTDDFTLVLLPENYLELKPMCDKYVLPYLEKKYSIESKRLTLKYFGDSSALNSALNSAKETFGDTFLCNVFEKNGDFTIDLLFKNGQDQLSKDVIRDIVLKLKDNIYAEFDTTLGERLFDLLRLKNLKLSVAESFTGGRVVSSVIANSGASAFVHEGIVSYSNQSKFTRLGVVGADLKRDGAVSSIVAYQMAAGLLKTGECDIALSTTGIAGPKSDDTNKPVGLCYVAVGMKDGVHTYRYNLIGSREEITETAKNTALFLAIKKLKNL